MSLIIPWLLGLYTFSSLGEQKQSLSSLLLPYRVAIQVSGDDSSVTASYIRREFRKFSDVEVVSLKENYNLAVRIVMIRTKTPQGYILAIAILEPWFKGGYALRPLAEAFYKTGEICPDFRIKIDANTLLPFKCMLEEAAKSSGCQPEVLRNLIVQSFPPDLEALCRRLVAQIDNDYIEPYRQGIRLFEQELDRLRLLKEGDSK